jgi:hypothetical protein
MKRSPDGRVGAAINGRWRANDDSAEDDDEEEGYGRPEGETERRPRRSGAVRQQLLSRSSDYGHVMSPSYYTLTDATALPTPSPTSSGLSLSMPTSLTPRSASSSSSRVARSSSRSSHRPPPLVLSHSASRSAALAETNVPSQPTGEAVILLEDAEKQRKEERLIVIREKTHFAHSLLHSASFVAFVLQQLLCTVLVVLASLWRHSAGIGIACGAFVIGLIGSIGQPAQRQRSGTFGWRRGLTCPPRAGACAQCGTTSSSTRSGCGSSSSSVLS